MTEIAVGRTVPAESSRRGRTRRHPPFAEAQAGTLWRPRRDLSASAYTP